MYESIPRSTTPTALPTMLKRASQSCLHSLPSCCLTIFAKSLHQPSSLLFASLCATDPFINTSKPSSKRASDIHLTAFAFSLPTQIEREKRQAKKRWGRTVEPKEEVPIFLMPSAIVVAQQQHLSFPHTVNLFFPPAIDSGFTMN